MSSTLAGHTAAGPMVGYLWQLERALVRLLDAPADASVGVEALDDVALVDSKTGEILGLEQDKSTIGTDNNLGDGSKNVWKTLSTWAAAAEKQEIDLREVALFLVTPAKVPDGIIKSISDSATPEQATEVLKSIKAEEVSKGARRYKEALLKCSNDTLTGLIIAVTLVDGNDNYVSGGLQAAIDHHYGFGDLTKSEQLAGSLLGWFLHRTLTLIRQGKEAWTDRKAFFKELNNQVERLSYRRALEAVEFVLQDSDVEAHRSSLFVKQLKLICAQQDEIVEAISDYLKAKALRTHWAVHSLVTREELTVLDESLVARWRNIHRMLCASAAPGTDESKTGLQVYYRTMDHRERVAGQETEQFFTTRGRYHALANDLSYELGWHPSFQRLLAEVSREDDEDGHGA